MVILGNDAIRAIRLVTSKVCETILEARPLPESLTEGTLGEDGEMVEARTTGSLDYVPPIDAELLKASGPIRKRAASLEPDAARPPPRKRGPPPKWCEAALAEAGGVYDEAKKLTGLEKPKMANYTAADVKRLRDETSAPMMECKQALEEAEGDVDRAKTSSARRARPPRASARAARPARASPPCPHRRRPEVGAVVAEVRRTPSRATRTLSVSPKTSPSFSARRRWRGWSTR